MVVKKEAKKPTTGRDGAKWTHDMIYMAPDDGGQLIIKTTDSGRSIIVENMKYHDGQFFVVDENGEERPYENGLTIKETKESKPVTTQTTTTASGLKCFKCKKNRVHGKMIQVGGESQWVCGKCTVDYGL